MPQLSCRVWAAAISIFLAALPAFAEETGLAVSKNGIGPAAVGLISAPALSENSDYSEYWEQQFLFNNNTLATSQFLIANLPFSKHHGMQVATLKQSGKDAVVIKNGRKRSGWSFSASEPMLTIFQHRLSGGTPDFSLQLHNTAAELDVSFAAPAGALPVVAAGNKLGLPQITLYAPTARAQARWRSGPEIGGPGPDGPWHEIGVGFGYGLHVVQQKVPNTVLSRWWRFTGAPSKAAVNPVLHAFETPKGKRYYALYLLAGDGTAIRFDVNEFKAGDNGEWLLKAKADGKTLVGSITLTDQLETFNLKDQLNAIEALAAGSMADVTRLRYAASYSFELAGNGTKTTLEGTALAEDIQMGEMKEKRRRKRR